VTRGRVYGGVLLTVAAAGVFLSVVGVAEVGLRVFSSAPVVTAVSAALWCRDWRLALPAAALLALFLAALAAGWFPAAGRLRGAFAGVAGGLGRGGPGGWPCAAALPSTYCVVWAAVSCLRRGYLRPYAADACRAAGALRGSVRRGP